MLKVAVLVCTSILMLSCSRSDGTLRESASSREPGQVPPLDPVFPSRDRRPNSKEVDVLVQRLASNPEDEEAQAAIQRIGTKDPTRYADVLEQIARRTGDRTHACYWLTEAAKVQADALGDSHHAAWLLLQAVRKDPMQDLPAERLTQLYRARNDTKGELALVEKRIKLLTPLLATHQDMAAKVAAMHVRAAELWAAPPMSDQKHSREHFDRAHELEPGVTARVTTSLSSPSGSLYGSRSVPKLPATPHATSR